MQIATICGISIFSCIAVRFCARVSILSRIATERRRLFFGGELPAFCFFVRISILWCRKRFIPIYHFQFIIPLPFPFPVPLPLPFPVLLPPPSLRRFQFRQAAAATSSFRARLMQFGTIWTARRHGRRGREKRRRATAERRRGTSYANCETGAERKNGGAAVHSSGFCWAERCGGAEKPQGSISLSEKIEKQLSRAENSRKFNRGVK